MNDVLLRTTFRKQLFELINEQNSYLLPTGCLFTWTMIIYIKLKRIMTTFNCNGSNLNHLSSLNLNTTFRCSTGINNKQ